MKRKNIPRRQFSVILKRIKIIKIVRTTNNIIREELDIPHTHTLRHQERLLYNLANRTHNLNGITLQNV